MELLLDDKLAPITSEIGFLEAEITEVISAYTNWMTPLQQRRGINLSRKMVSGNLEHVLHTLLPLTSHEPKRVIFVPTTNQWTAYFDSMYRGTDSGSTLAVLSNQMQCKGLRIVAIPNTVRKVGNLSKGRYGGTVLQVYGPEKAAGVNYRRLISVINDGGKWVFDNIGTPFPFERTEKYRLIPTKNRFDFRMLASYLENFKIYAFDKNFYTSHPTKKKEGIEKTKRGV